MPQPQARAQLPVDPDAQPETTGLADSRVSQRRGGHAILELQEEAFLQGAQSVPLFTAASQYHPL